MIRLLPVFVLVAFATALAGQEVDINKYRTIDGTFNNLNNTSWGSAGEDLKLIVPLAYSDGISAPAGLDRPNPRDVSNVVAEQIGTSQDPFQLSDFCWVFGQFLDHDIGLTPDGNEFFPISVTAGDKWFDPFNTGQVMIPMRRNIFDPSTGTSTDNPRRHPNVITAFIDGSGVYGSDLERENYLRSFEGGKLRMSAGNLLPLNTVTGELDGEVDPNAPHMDDAVGMSERLFVAGDARANENILLLSFHTIFAREHNRLCDELALEHPDWTDEELYQYARKINSGFIQSIVFNEFLPSMGIHLPDYQGYNPEVNPQLSNLFTAAAYRLGHTLLNGNLQRVNLDGTPHPDGPVALRNAFFNPMLAYADGGIDVFLKGMGTQMQQELDAKIVDDVRNFLFGPPGSGGLDLAAININRGRERGLPDLNTIRKTLGLHPYSIFREINYSNVGTSFDLLSSYSSINTIDPWVGMLAERRMPGAIVGETLMEVLTRQFTELRDGDRFYYMNDPLLSDDEKEMINKTTLNKIIMRNTFIDLMQDNVFAAMPHEQICANMTVEVLGNVWTEIGSPVFNVGIDLQADNTFLSGFTTESGRFGFSAIPGCGTKNISLNKEDDHANGLSTLDLILVQKHILNRDPLDSPYKLLAADVDMSGSVSTLDLIKMRKVILSIDLKLNNETSWRFIPEHFVFTDPTDPFLDVIPTQVELSSNDYSQNFIAVKLGDVNNSANPGTTQATGGLVEARNQPFHLQLDNIDLQAGEQYNVQITAAQLAQVTGYQFGLRFNPSAIEVIDIQANGLSNMSEANFAILNQEGLVANSWNTADGEPLTIKAGERLFTLTIQAKATAKLNEVLQLDQRGIRAEAYGTTLNTTGIELGYSDVVATTFALFQNRPNPFSESTQINFYLPQADKVDLTVFDASGRTVLHRSSNFEAGQQQFLIERSELGIGGVYYYRVATQAGASTKKMVLR